MRILNILIIALLLPHLALGQSVSAGPIVSVGPIIGQGNGAAACGGTSPYPCARTDTAVADVVSLPSWGLNICSLGSATSCGNLAGANTTITDPSFGEKVTRLTDNTYSNVSMQVTAGSGDNNRWNTNSTFLVTQDTNGFDRFWSWNGTTRSGSRIYLGALASGLSYAGNSEYSRTTSTTVYLFPSISITPKTKLGKYDLSTCTTLPSCGSTAAPTEQTVFDFTSSSNCLGSGFAATWTDDGGVAAGDAEFASSFSNSGGQGGAGAVYAAVWSQTNGCILLNTATGAITADPGWNGTPGLTCSPNCTGSLSGWTATFTNGFAIHNNKIFRNGNTLELTPCFGSAPGSCGIGCTASACNNDVFWNITSGTFTQPSGSIGGHFTEGYNTYVNNPQSMKLVGRQPLTPSTVTAYTTSISTTVDMHQGWNNVDSLDTLPFCFSTFDLNVGSGFTAPYVNEIDCAKPDTSNTRWRFAHTYNTNTSTDPNFGIEEVIGSLSQDGNWYAYGTNGMGQFGSENGSSSCTLGGTSGGTNCRGEVLIVNLQ